MVGASVDIVTTNTHKSRTAGMCRWTPGWKICISRFGICPRVQAVSTYSVSPKQLSFLFSEGKKIRRSVRILSVVYFQLSLVFSVYSLVNSRFKYWVSLKRTKSLRKEIWHWKRLHLRLFERRLYQRSAFVHVTSLGEKKELERVGLGRRFVLAPNAVQVVASEWPNTIRRFLPGRWRAMNY